ncbi:hypothetical protein ACJJTC_015696 [Scirpophaga incertulas]
MKQFIKFVLPVVLFFGAHCEPYDDGKYNPKKYSVSDDGKYYRPVDEGKYVPGDEGKYTYVYSQSLYPAFPYIHMVGPDGGYGGNGGFGGDGGFGNGGGYGPNGPGGPRGPGGPGGPDGPGEPDESQRIQYIGRKVYAERYPYIYKVIKSLVNKYVSGDLFFAETPEGSTNHYSKAYADKESVVKCKYLTPTAHNEQEFVTQYPPRLAAAEGEKLGSYYSIKGVKSLKNTAKGPDSKIKVEYEIFVRVVDDAN